MSSYHVAIILRFIAAGQMDRPDPIPGMDSSQIWPEPSWIVRWSCIMDFVKQKNACVLFHVIIFVKASAFLVSLVVLMHVRG